MARVDLQSGGRRIILMRRFIFHALNNLKEEELPRILDHFLSVMGTNQYPVVVNKARWIMSIKSDGFWGIMGDLVLLEFRNGLLDKPRSL